VIRFGVAVIPHASLAQTVEALKSKNVVSKVNFSSQWVSFRQYLYLWDDRMHFVALSVAQGYRD
jgi:hypothetical protein